MRLLRRNVRNKDDPEAAHDQHPPEAQGSRVSRLPERVRGQARHGQPRQDRSRGQRGHQVQREVPAEAGRGTARRAS